MVDRIKLTEDDIICVGTETASTVNYKYFVSADKAIKIRQQILDDHESISQLKEIGWDSTIDLLRHYAKLKIMIDAIKKELDLKYHYGVAESIRKIMRTP